MLNLITRPFVSAAVLGLAISAVPVQAEPVTIANSNSIQPETTISITATAQEMVAPDMAYLTGGVVTEAKTAGEALKENATRMQGVFKALKAAGLPEKFIQTSNFNIQPKWEYPKEGERYISGYTVTNQVTARVEDLAKVGGLIDAMVNEGGNTFNGVRFALKDSTEIENTARRQAMKDAMARAKLYADIAGYDVARIVTIHESDGGPVQVQSQRMRTADFKESATPISGGELTWSASVSVTFELTKK